MISSIKSYRCVLQWIAVGMSVSGLSLAALSVWADEPSERTHADREALSRFQNYIGDWKGVGQPKRGSSKDAWSEECQWAWSFHEGNATLSLSSPNGKYIRQATLKRTAADKYELIAKPVDGDELHFTGGLDEQGYLVLIAAQSRENDKETNKNRESGPNRITIRTVANGDRLLMLYERRAEGDRFARLAEVGFTRKGSGFGQGTNYVECVVTGGVGTIPVTHHGQMYYVCCTGCRDYFNDNPEEVLAEYKARKAEEKKKKKSQ